MATSGAREVRKTVTIVFSDISGSTELAERIDPEAVRNVLGRYFDTMREVLVRHGASVEKYIGDAVMAVFGVPQLHEDDALRALRAAVEMRSALAELNGELEREAGVRLESCTGVNSGEVVTGENAERERLVTGDAVNVAARLQQAAAPGEILIGEATRRLAEAAVEVAPLEPLTVKGKQEPLRAWRLLGVVAGASAFVRRLDAPMVGRQQELTALREAVERAFATSVPHTLTVLGPAGIGKSRLVDELLAGIGEDARVLLGRCLPYGEGITYWPLAEILRQAAGGDHIGGLKTVVDSDLARERIAGAIGLGSGVGSSQEIFWSARILFEQLARELPLLVVFDDIHWAEPTFLDLLEYVRGFAADVPLVMLCQGRPDLLEVRPAWAAPAANTTTLVLQPLSDAESRALARSLHDGVDEELLNRIVGSAEGYPLFVEQMLAMVGEARAGELEVPPTIQVLLGARIDSLEPAERMVIEAASVEGGIFHRGSIEYLLPESARSELGTRLMALVRKGLIKPDRSVFAGDDGFRFGHLLIRDAVYLAIPKAVRASHHEGHAGWLERAAGAQLGEYEEILGYHLQQAFECRRQLGPPDEHARALGARAGRLLGAAGRRAYARSDIAAAINLLERATSLPAADVAERLELVLMLSLALDFGGDSQRAAGLASEALADAENYGDGRLVALARAQAGAVRLHTDPSATAEEYAEVLAEAVKGCEEAHDEYGLALSWRRLGWVQQLQGRYGASVETLERAVSHAQAAGHAREETLALGMLTESVALGPTPVDEATRRCLAVLESGSELAPQRPAACTALAVLYAMQGEHGHARASAALGWHVLEPFGERYGVAQAVHLTGFLELLAGDPAAAERTLRQSHETLTAMGDSGSLALTAALLAEALHRQGRDDEALLLADEAAALASPDDFGTQSAWRSTRARVLAVRGEHDAAEQLAREAVQAVEQTDDVLHSTAALLALAEVLQAAGRTSEALPFVDRALAICTHKGDVVGAARARALRDQQFAAVTSRGHAASGKTE
jgi:class 3 adenylate cyclase/tetratricopeptide (TPR) repeat protein